MCNVCCKECRGWCKSFTKTETLLAVLEAVLFVVLITFIVFLILHFLACYKRDNDVIIYATTKSDAKYPTKATAPTEKYSKPTETYSRHTEKYKTGKYYPQTKKSKKSTIKCSWTPSVKTTAKTRYYKDSVHIEQTTQQLSTKLSSIPSATEFNINHSILINTSNTESSTSLPVKMIDLDIAKEYIGEDFTQSDETDGEDAEEYKRYALALVKLKPPQDVAFGCILTIITKYWTLTAASCIESIEEVDSLDSFVMIENYGSPRKGTIHSVSDIEIHPSYEGANKNFDLAALKSEDSLVPGPGYAVDLPSVVDHFLVTIGERFVMLGYGAFRTIDKGPSGRKLRKVYVYSLPTRQCSSEDAWSLRHLVAGGAEAAGALGAGEGRVCAGVLFARGAPCNYCGGAPLLRGSTLLGLMADNRHCGVACEPQIFVSIALLRDWIDSIVDT